MLRSIFVILGFLGIIVGQASLGLADMSASDEFEKWDQELNQSWDALEKVNPEQEPVKTPTVNKMETPVKRKSSVTVESAKTGKPLAYEEESIDSRQVSDLQARIDRLEGRVKQLERANGSLEDQIRSLDRTVNDLRRKI